MKKLRRLFFFLKISRIIERLFDKSFVFLENIISNLSSIKSKFFIPSSIYIFPSPSDLYYNRWNILYGKMYRKNLYALVSLYILECWNISCSVKRVSTSKIEEETQEKILLHFLVLPLRKYLNFHGYAGEREGEGDGEGREGWSGGASKNGSFVVRRATSLRNFELSHSFNNFISHSLTNW